MRRAAVDTSRTPAKSVIASPFMSRYRCVDVRNFRPQVSQLAISLRPAERSDLWRECGKLITMYPMEHWLLAEATGRWQQRLPARTCEVGASALDVGGRPWKSLDV